MFNNRSNCNKVSSQSQNKTHSHSEKEKIYRSSYYNEVMSSHRINMIKTRSEKLKQTMSIINSNVNEDPYQLVRSQKTDQLSNQLVGSQKTDQLSNY